MHAVPSPPRWSPLPSSSSAASAESHRFRDARDREPTRQELGLEDPQVYDTEAAVVTAVEAMRKLIRKGRAELAAK